MINCIQDSGICMAMIGLLYALPNTQLTRRLLSEDRLFHLSSRTVSEADIDQTTSGLNFVTKIPRTEILSNFIKVIENVYHPVNYYKRIVYTGLKIKTRYRHKPDFKTTLIYLRSFLRVCKEAGFSSETGLLYWKMFFTVIIHNPKGIEAAVNLAAMYIHFQKQKSYIISVTTKMINDIEESGEELFNLKMTGS
jgi:hypothetical protein